MTAGRPGAVAVRLNGARLQADPAGLRALYEEIRRQHGQVAEVTLDGGVPAWLALGYREVRHITSNPTLFTRDWRRWRLREQVPADWPPLAVIAHGADSVLQATGEAHHGRVAATNAAWEAVDVFDVQRRVERTADRLVDDFCAQGEAELVAQYATPLPALVLAEVCGYPRAAEAAGDLARCGDLTLDAADGGAVAGADGGARHEARAAARRLRAATRALVAARGETPRPDVASTMLARAGTAGDAGQEAVTGDLLVAVITAHPPLADWIAGTLRLMITDERFAASLFGGQRRSVDEAMNEVLWDDGPVQNWAVRFAVGDVRLGGRTIRAGDMVILGIGAAHGDPLVHCQGHAAARSRATFAFGHGEHRCPFAAQELGETLARTGVAVLLDRLPDVALAVPHSTLVWRPSAWLRGLSALPVHFAATPARVARD